MMLFFFKVNLGKIVDRFQGTWKSISCENFEEYMKRLGAGSSTLTCTVYLDAKPMERRSHFLTLLHNQIIKKVISLMSELSNLCQIPAKKHVPYWLLGNILHYRSIYVGLRCVLGSYLNPV